MPDWLFYTLIVLVVVLIIVYFVVRKMGPKEED